MPHPPQQSPLETHMHMPWQAPGAAADTSLGLLPALVRCRPDLLPRVAAYYTQLQALPRRVRRALQRQWRLSLASIALLLALGQQPGLAATVPVSAGCTLVDAITAANTDTATGGCPAGSGADTITLPADSTQTLTEVTHSTIAGNDNYDGFGGGVLNSSIGILTITHSTIAGNRVFSGLGGIVNNLVAPAGDVDTAFDPTPVANGPVGTFTITATFTNTSATSLRFPFFSVSDLSGGHLVLNADGGPGRGRGHRDARGGGGRAGAGSGGDS